jgi:SAM-dependent methyltransferase
MPGPFHKYRKYRIFRNVLGIANFALIFLEKLDNCVDWVRQKPLFNGGVRMRGSSHNLQLFDGPDPGSMREGALDPPADLSQANLDRVECLACRETWRIYPSRRPTSDHQPLTLPWYEQIEQRRYARHGRWIPGLLEFHRHPGDHVLGLGDGLGTDWVRYAMGGAEVHYVSTSNEQLAIVRENFKLRGLTGKFHHATLEAMPYADNTMDVVCLSGFGSEIESIQPAIDEIFRVLKPGGKILAVVPAKYNSRYWQDFWFPWNKATQHRADERNQFSARGLRRLFDRFSELRFYKRHLRRSDLPHIWRWMLLPFLERIMGRFLVLKAFKPVNSAMTAASVAA